MPTTNNVIIYPHNPKQFFLNMKTNGRISMMVKKKNSEPKRIYVFLINQQHQVRNTDVKKDFHPN